MMNSKESFGAEEEDLGVLYIERLRSKKLRFNYRKRQRQVEKD